MDALRDELCKMQALGAPEPPQEVKITATPQPPARAAVVLPALTDAEGNPHPLDIKKSHSVVALAKGCLKVGVLGWTREAQDEWDGGEDDCCLPFDPEVFPVAGKKRFESLETFIRKEKNRADVMNVGEASECCVPLFESMVRALYRCAPPVRPCADPVTGLLTQLRDGNASLEDREISVQLMALDEVLSRSMAANKFNLRYHGYDMHVYRLLREVLPPSSHCADTTVLYAAQAFVRALIYLGRCAAAFNWEKPQKFSEQLFRSLIRLLPSLTSEPISEYTMEYLFKFRCKKTAKK